MADRTAVPQATSVVEPTECVGCGEMIRERFCAHCGEMRPDARDHSLRHFLSQAVETFTQLDTKIGRTLRVLLARPGQLTAEYMRGLRTSYVPPLQLFLIANVAFFLLNGIHGFNTFTTPLFVHLDSSPYSEFARSIALPRIAEMNIALPEYALRFDAAAAVQAKTLVIIMVPLLSVFVMAVYWRARKFYVQHLIFSLHFYAFFMLLISAWNATVALVLRGLAGIGSRPSATVVDNYFGLVIMAGIGAYLLLSLRTIYHERLWVTVGKALALTFAVALILQLYRFILFFVILYST